MQSDLHNHESLCVFPSVLRTGNRWLHVIWVISSFLGSMIVIQHFIYQKKAYHFRLSNVMIEVLSSNLNTIFEKRKSSFVSVSEI